MSTSKIRFTLLFALGAQLFAGSPAPSTSLKPCQILPAEAWGNIMGYTTTATPGEMFCTYSSPNNTNGGQFRIMSVVASSAEAGAVAKRMRDHQAHQRQSKHDPRLGVVDSQGTVVFSIALFQPDFLDGNASQLQQLVAVVKQHLPK